MKTIIQALVISIFIFNVAKISAQEKKETVNDVIEEGIERRAEEKKEELKNKRGRDWAKKPTIDMSPTDSEIRDVLRITTGQDKAKVRDSYTFEVAITTQIQDLSKRKPKKQLMTQHYGPAATMMAMEKGQLMLTDLNSETIVIINTKSKTAQTMSSAFMGKFIGKALDYMVENGDDVSETPKITKLEGTKTIAGYTAEGYHMETEDGAVEVWYSTAIPTSFFKNAAGFMSKYMTMPANNESLGYPLLITQINKKGKKTTEMRVTEINMSPLTITMSDYKVMNVFGN
ncbi:hypothetical protein ULMS_02480 [Patiriisocius marinistellae]|uniref:DUF4412 domain-containing protein n=1 Tax=Patiriisocius marinistellae TaxID=2494560 RepID=A0A5J4FT72_9FLAO|nr:hypothetical protein [Patiriisocius marinistellae]GEQ84740.1 hypothetical protein ULMS_02480 [Patiriisocius marinistellae]